MHRVLVDMRVTFNYMCKDMCKLIVSVVLSRLEYAAVVWSLYRKEHIKELHSTQRSTANLTPSLAELLLKKD